MISRSARVGSATISVVLLLAVTPNRLHTAFGISFAVVVASTRMAGERHWSLLPIAALAATLISPADALLIVGVSAAATLVVVAVFPAATLLEAATNFASAAGATLFAALASPSIGPSLKAGSIGWSVALALFALGAAWFVADTVMWMLHEPLIRLTYRDAAARLLRDWRVAVILVASAYAVAALWQHNPLWAAATAALPLVLASQLAEQVRRHRSLVDLSVEAMGRLPEAAGVAQRGHAKHVTALAVAMGRVGGLAGSELETLRRAALLHDVGLIEVARPDGNRELFTSADVHRWGARLIEGNEDFKRETELVAAMADPYRIPGADPLTDRRAQIVRVACRAVSMLEVDPVHQVVESIYGESLYTFDPQAIALVAPAIGLLGWPSLPDLS